MFEILQPRLILVEAAIWAPLKHALLDQAIDELPRVHPTCKPSWPPLTNVLATRLLPLRLAQAVAVCVLAMRLPPLETEKSRGRDFFKGQIPHAAQPTPSC